LDPHDPADARAHAELLQVRAALLAELGASSGSRRIDAVAQRD
jgi:hypothetical protein